MDEKDIAEYLSLQELGAVIDKIGFQNELPRSGRQITAEKDNLYQIRNPINIDEEESLEKNPKDEVTEGSPPVNSIHSNEGKAEIATYEAQKFLWIPINRNVVEKFALTLVLCAISTTIILPFFLLIGGSVRPLSSTISYDYDESCDNVTSDVNTYSESCFAYGNGVCEAFLTTGGLTNNITTLRSNIVSEQDVVLFFNVLDTYTSIVTEECREATKPFICRYVFPPCDDDGSYQLISKDECLYIQHDVCASEWLIALSVAPELVPNCEQLSSTSDEDIEESDKDFEQLSNLTNTTECAENFGLFCDNRCLPLCSKFSQYDEITTTRRKNFDIFAAIVAIVGGTLSIIFIVIRRNKMLEYPAIFTLYITFCPLIVAILILITHIDTERTLYCPYDTLLKSHENPSAFCQLSGATFQFCLILMSIFWLFHLFHVFLKVVFPVKSRFLTTRKWNRKLHIAEILVSILISALGPATVWIAGIKYGFSFFPPLLCLPTSRAFVFYTMSVPLMILLTLGLNMTATIIWTLLKKNDILSEASGRKKCLVSTPEVKVIILLMYFIVFGLLMSIYTGKTLMEAELKFDSLYAYLLCQLHGDNPACRKFQEDYFDSQTPEITSTVFIMMGLINWVNMLFVVQYQDIKRITIKISNLFHNYTKPKTMHTITNSSSLKASETGSTAKATDTDTQV